ncbi:phenylacetic acid degradation protein [Amylibacter marinus]|uniref:Phenylacetic acid degradation protein n=1 Tax=Amylibacter marinus TaxID=1475483 RepID=A0ABQ5VV34_9RHOB|nr:1,2-phenylacetyl-CoA epoxidase subunit PaaC [Amylibacter marinus]GLQ35154.1 phenylacetic acid degradation protein [Amylibacter marinus]
MGNDVLFETLLRLADNHLILGHRLSEWCGHAPMLEEDLAMPNIALDLIGQSRALYAYAAEIENQGRSEDDLAFLRLEKDYHNILMVERPNGDFGHTMLRQFLFSSFMVLFWERAQNSTDKVLSGIAGKAFKESQYHVRHTAEWIIRLGDGTEESHKRMTAATAALAPYIGELFEADAVDQSAISAGIIPRASDLRGAWETQVRSVYAEATLEPILDHQAQTGGRIGQHTEDMGFLLAQLQYVQRTYPNMTW